MNTSVCEDELTIIHQVQSTPTKKCNGSIREFFKSPAKVSLSPLEPASLSASSQSTKVGDSQDIQQFSSPSSGRHPTCSSTPFLVSGTPLEHIASTELTSLPLQSSGSHVISSDEQFPKIENTLIDSPASSLSRTSKSCAVKTLFTSPNKAAYSDDEDLFGGDFDDLEDLDYEEIDISLTQIAKNNDKPSPKLELCETELHEQNLSPKPVLKRASKRRVKKPEGTNVNAILEQVLDGDHNAYLEEEVSRLYKRRDENVDSTNFSNITKLDKLLERSYKSSNRTPTSNKHDDTLEGMLHDLGRSPSSVTPPSPATPPIPMASSNDSSQRLPSLDLLESPPRQIPDM